MALEQLGTVFSAMGAILLAATLIGRLLALRYPADAPHPVVANLNARIEAWWIMVAVAALAFVFGKLGVIVLFSILSFASLREFITLTRSRRGDHPALLAAFFLVLPLQHYFIWRGWDELYSFAIPVYAFLLMPILSAVRAETKQFLERVAEIQWGLMICVFCLSHVPALTTLNVPGDEGRELLLIVFLVFVAQSSDVLQYVCGKLAGRHQIAPRLSAGKTVEGFAGGILGATALGAACWWLTPFRAWEAALLALVISLMGFFGGLVMSAIKRDRGIKDWGWAIQGHGGVLDRLDSVVFAAPIFFHLVRHFWAA